MFESFNNEIISSLAFESRFPVGSSANIKAGSFIIALPIETLCCCPPDINIGLIELKNFNFRLDKYISKILIQNSAGTTVKEYTDATVAKAELDGKKINGTTVIIEYEIKVTNIGEVDGYVRKIVDYMPSDLKFSSELNKDWYQTGTDLYNTSLANEKITAGQSKSVKVL